MTQKIWHPCELAELKRQCTEIPWIRFRNDLITALVRKRREVGLSPQDLAETLGTSHSAISRFEYMPWPKQRIPAIPQTPTVKFIARYANALGMDIEFQLVPKGGSNHASR